MSGLPGGVARVRVTVRISRSTAITDHIVTRAVSAIAERLVLLSVREAKSVVVMLYDIFRVQPVSTMS